MTSSNEFETERAKYTQVYAVHTRPIEAEVFNTNSFGSIDGVVLEAYHGKKWFDLLWGSPLKKNYESVFTAVQQTGKPMYVVDVLTTAGGRGFEQLGNTVLNLLGLAGAISGIQKIKEQKKEKRELSRREFLKFWGLQSGKIAGGAFLLSDFLCRHYVLATENNPEILARIASWRMHAFPTPQLELRNAISARKIEDFVVPELQKILGRKPHLALVYGAGHSGLKEDLQYPSLRNAVLNIYHSQGYPGIDRTHLDTITDVKIKPDGGYALAERKAGLF